MSEGDDPDKNNHPFDNLINENYDGKEELILDQWKLYVEKADKISDRRDSANRFFLTSNSILLVAIGIIVEADTIQWTLLILLVGLLNSLIWLGLIRSYKNLNTAKFKVINEAEKILPLRTYSTEWDLLQEGENKKIYWPLTHIEQLVPVSLGIVYFISILIVSFYIIF